MAAAGQVRRLAIRGEGVYKGEALDVGGALERVLAWAGLNGAELSLTVAEEKLGADHLKGRVIGEADPWVRVGLHEPFASPPAPAQVQR